MVFLFMANCGLSLFTNVAYAGTGSETSGVVIPVGPGSSGQVKIAAVDQEALKIKGISSLLESSPTDFPVIYKKYGLSFS